MSRIYQQQPRSSIPSKWSTTTSTSSAGHRLSTPSPVSPLNKPAPPPKPSNKPSSVISSPRSSVSASAQQQQQPSSRVQNESNTPNKDVKPPSNQPRGNVANIAKMFNPAPSTDTQRIVNKPVLASRQQRTRTQGLNREPPLTAPKPKASPKPTFPSSNSTTPWIKRGSSDEKAKPPTPASHAEVNSEPDPSLATPTAPVEKKPSSVSKIASRFNNNIQPETAVKPNNKSSNISVRQFTLPPKPPGKIELPKPSAILGEQENLSKVTGTRPEPPQVTVEGPSTPRNRFPHILLADRQPPIRMLIPGQKPPTFIRRSPMNNSDEPETIIRHSAALDKARVNPPNKRRPLSMRDVLRPDRSDLIVENF